MTSDFSGKYYFYSLHKNVGVYIREPGRVASYSSRQFFLVYNNGFWHITDDDEKYCCLWGNDGGYFRLVSKGQFSVFKRGCTV